MKLTIVNFAAAIVLFTLVACNNQAKEELKDNTTEVSISADGEGDGTISVTGDSTTVKDDNGNEIKLGKDGISVKGEDGAEVKIDKDGVSIKEGADDDKTEVTAPGEKTGDTKIEIKGDKVNVKAGKNTGVKVDKNGKVDVNAGGVKVKVN
jgi:uncharacterized lipoprotein NlpE involved in copper resistance